MKVPDTIEQTTKGHRYSTTHDPGDAMRTINESLVGEYAEALRPLLPVARKAYGTQGPNSPARLASDQVNALILDYVKKGGNITHLANELGPDVISLAGLRRRLRSARSGVLLGATTGTHKRGSKDPERVAAAAEKIREARGSDSQSYGSAVRDVYNDGVSLSAVARELDVSYFSLWTAGSHTS